MTSTNPLESLQVIIEDFRRFQPEIKMLHEELSNLFEVRRLRIKDLDATTDKIRDALRNEMDALRRSKASVPAATYDVVNDVFDCLYSITEISDSMHEFWDVCSGRIATQHKRID